MCEKCKEQPLELLPEFETIFQGGYEGELYPQPEWNNNFSKVKNYVSPFFNWITGSSSKPATGYMPSGVNYPKPPGNYNKSVTETQLVKNSIAGGERDEKILTNLVFYKRHPQLGGKQLSSSMPNFLMLGKEWVSIRDTIVRPALQMPSSPLTGRSSTATQGINWATVLKDQRVLYVMKLLINKYRLPVNGASGLVGNLLEQSELLPNRIEGSSAGTPMKAQDFQGQVKDFSAVEIMNRNYTNKTGPKLPGVGLAQWTLASRRVGLFQHTFNGRKSGAAILFDMDAQVDYLVYELQSKYRNVYKVITAAGVTVNDASDETVYNFETPGAVLDANGTQLPRSNALVQAVFIRRRKSAEHAFSIYNHAQS